MTLPIDTGVFFAYADTSDQDHERCLTFLDGVDDELLTTALVVAETGWLIERQLGPRFEARFYRMIADDEIRVETLTDKDWRRVVELTEAYADNGFGGVDSSLIAVAERLNLDTVATLDHRHFRVVRPNHVEASKLVP